MQYPIQNILQHHKLIKLNIIHARQNNFTKYMSKQSEHFERSIKKGKKKKMIEEEQLVERLAPRIEERIKYSVVKSIINALEEQFYPPEEMIKEEFIKNIKAVEQEIKEGGSKRYSYDEFKKEFLVE